MALLYMRLQDGGALILYSCCILNNFSNKLVGPCLKHFIVSLLTSIINKDMHMYNKPSPLIMCMNCIWLLLAKKNISGFEYMYINYNWLLITITIFYLTKMSLYSLILILQ